MLARRIVKCKSSTDKKQQFSLHISKLNKQFAAWFEANIVARDSPQYLIEGAQDYIDYVNQLQSLYLRTYGEVLTFGSGMSLLYQCVLLFSLRLV